ncbi:MAG: hypothetical protein CMD04_04825 [Flavobacteriales bacterium]|nr:hypothetical protein [Flavobacteriales bacterium]|tara:strand:- start:517 stop:774 length:258 start_codon:yes stop_codon:yes gene_type:complete
MFEPVLINLYNIMDKVFKYFNDFFKGLTGLLMTLLGLAVAIQILFGGAVFGMDVIGHVSAIITALGDGGFVGLLTLLILYSFLTK